MSTKGDQNNPKHGGAHVISHVGQSVLKKHFHGDNQNGSGFVKPAILLSDSNGTSYSIVQDGVDENRQQTELEAFIENHSDEMVSEFEGNAEWITTTVDDLGHITFSPRRDDDPLGVVDSEPKFKISNINDAIFDVVERSMGNSSMASCSVDPATSFVDSNPHLHIKLESAIGAKSSPCSPVHSFIKSEALCIANGRQRSFSNSEEKLTAQDRACLEEIERGSQLTLEDQELIEDSKQRLQLELQDFDTSATDKSSSLMTAQELQTLQERGLDFDANDVCDDPQTALTSADDLALASTAVVVSPSQIAQHVAQPDPTLATISITTNKKENSTEIVIDTKTGKQVFQLNTSDLSKAAGARQPITLVGDDGTTQEIFLEDLEDQPEINIASDGRAAQTKQREKSKAEKIKSLPGSHMCQECGICFAKLSKLKLHVMGHMGEKPFKCVEPGCDWAFSTSYKLKRHMECHEGKKDFPCTEPDCGRKFTTIYNLATHQKLHERPLTEPCLVDGCTESFASKKLRDIHLKTHGDAGRQYQCPHPGCEKMFYSELTMGSHKKMHQRSEPIRCQFDGCGKEFEKLSRLTSHMRCHTGERPYVCTMEGCAWAFPTASKLRRHRSKHTGERRYACPITDCGKCFMRPEHLKGHMVVHSKDKPFICSVQGCNTSFTAKSSWYVHVKKHEQRRDAIVYYCPLEGCDRKYKDKVGLRAHIDKHYSKATGDGTPGDNASKRAAALALVNGDTSCTLLSGAGGEQEELEQSLASIIDQPSSTPVHIVPAPPPPSASPGVSLLTDPTQGLVIRTADGPAFVTYADLIASGVDLSTLGLIPSSPSVTVDEEPMDIMTDMTAESVLDVPVMQQQQPAVSQPQQNLIKKNFPQQQSVSAAAAPVPVTAPEPDDGGSARTDFTRNHLLSTRAKQRRHILRQKSHGSGSSLDFTGIHHGMGSMLPSSSLMDSTDLLLGGTSSQSLSIRDPETGAIYVQTQLLQDDPPETPLMGDEAIMPSLMHDPQLTAADHDDMDIMDTAVVTLPSTFTGSTINLHDLQG